MVFSRAIGPLLGLLLVWGCRKAEPVAKPAGSSVSAPTSAVAPHVSGAAPAAATSAPPPRPAAPKPTPLDAAGQKSAHTYARELGLGRKATIAKDFEQADLHFSRCLDALPKDPRALGERGYARLLAGKLAEARTDLGEAERSAPNTTLRLQILHNLAQLERKLGNEAAAQAYEEQRTKAKAARRLPSGVDCSSDVSESDLELKVATSFDEVLKLVLAAHTDADKSDPSEVKLYDFGEEGYEQRIKSLAKQQPFPDGALVLATSGPGSSKNHGVIAQAGKFYVYPNLSSGSVALCGPEGLADVTIEGGGARPWRIQRSYRLLVRSYDCVENCGGDAAVFMGSCWWTSSSRDVTFLEAGTFRGLRRISANAQPSSEGTATEPEHFLELEWQADRVAVDACGQHQDVPYAGD